MQSILRNGRRASNIITIAGIRYVNKGTCEKDRSLVITGLLFAHLSYMRTSYVIPCVIICRYPRLRYLSYQPTTLTKPFSTKTKEKGIPSSSSSTTSPRSTRIPGVIHHPHFIQRRSAHFIIHKDRE